MGITQRTAVTESTAGAFPLYNSLDKTAGCTARIAAHNWPHVLYSRGVAAEPKRIFLCREYQLCKETIQKEKKTVQQDASVAACTAFSGLLSAVEHRWQSIYILEQFKVFEATQLLLHSSFVALKRNVCACQCSKRSVSLEALAHVSRSAEAAGA